MSTSPLQVWHGIEAAEAEARLVNLRRRQAQLEEAYHHQQEIRRHHPDSLAVELSGHSLDARKSLIENEMSAVLKYRVNEPIRMTLNGREFHNHSANIATLSWFLLRLQKLYSAVAQSIHSGPTLRGPIAAALREATEMRLSQVYASSFGMELYVPSKLDLVGDSVPTESLNGLFRLLTASGNEGSLLKVSGSLGGRVTNHLRHLTTHLANTDSTLNLSWRDATGSDHLWTVSPQLATTIVGNLKSIIHTSSSEKTFSGTIVGGSIFRNTFEVLRHPDGTLIEGSMVPGLATTMKERFGSMCTVTVDETELLDKGTGEKSVYYVLIGIK